MEQFANSYESALDGGINGVVTTLTVVSAAGAPSTGNFRLRIDDELLLVTGVSSLVFTVTRGAEGTTPAAHADGAIVQLVLTKGALDQKRIDDVGAGVFSSAPTAGVAGRLYLPDDATAILRDDGSSLVAYGPLFKLKPVPSTGWSWDNQSSASVSTTNLGQLLHKESSGITGIAGRYRTMAVSPPITLEVGFIYHAVTSYGYGGIFMRKGASGEIMFFMIGMDNSSLRMEVLRYSTASTFSGAAIAQEVLGFCWTIVWMRIVYDGTDLFFYVSNDKVYWRLVYTESKIYGFATGGPDQTGFAIGLASANIAIGLHIISWDEY